MSKIITNIDSFFQVCKAPGVIVGIDYGSRCIGVAISDPSMKIALPYKVIDVKNIKDHTRPIVDICQHQRSICCVIGFPLNMDGSKSNQTLIVEQFAAKLSLQIEIPIFFYDERCSSKAANMMLKEIGMNRKQRHEIDDSISAQVILEGFLTYIARIHNTTN